MTREAFRLNPDAVFLPYIGPSGSWFEKNQRVVVPLHNKRVNGRVTEELCGTEAHIEIQYRAGIPTDAYTQCNGCEETYGK